MVLKEAWLTVLDGFRPGRQLILSRELTVLGRADHLPLPLLGPAARDLEAEHAVIRRARDGTYTIQDNATRCGTALNQQRLAGPAPLTDGDLLRLGGNLIRFNQRRQLAVGGQKSPVLPQFAGGPALPPLPVPPAVPGRCRPCLVRCRRRGPSRPCRRRRGCPARSNRPRPRRPVRYSRPMRYSRPPREFPLRRHPRRGNGGALIQLAVVFSCIWDATNKLAASECPLTVPPLAGSLRNMGRRRAIFMLWIVWAATMNAAWAPPSAAAAGRDRDPLTGRPLKGPRSRLAHQAAATVSPPKPAEPPAPRPPAAAAEAETAQGSDKDIGPAEPLPHDPAAEQYVSDAIARQRMQVETDSGRRLPPACSARPNGRAGRVRPPRRWGRWRRNSAAAAAWPRPPVRPGPALPPIRPAGRRC